MAAFHVVAVDFELWRSGHSGVVGSCEVAVCLCGIGAHGTFLNHNLASESAFGLAGEREFEVLRACAVGDAVSEFHVLHHGLSGVGDYQASESSVGTAPRGRLCMWLCLVAVDRVLVFSVRRAPSSWRQWKDVMWRVDAPFSSMVYISTLASR